MAEDTQSSILGRRRVRRGPLVVTNPGNDSDEDARGWPGHRSSPRNPQPLPSPSSHSPYSEQSSLPSTSYTPKSSMPLKAPISDQSSSYAVRSNLSNPSLSSPSGSCSPAVESTPPPSTPGQHTPTEGGMTPAVEKPSSVFSDDKQDVRQHNNAARMSMMDRVKQHLPLYHAKNNNGSRQSPVCLTHKHELFLTTDPFLPLQSPIVTNNSSYVSPTRDAISNKVLLTVTTDCDNYTPLDISGARNAAIIKEKIFSKLQISDDQQIYFSIYRTEIGSFAIGSALSDERLMDICREEGDSKGSVKLLVQHSSAAVHLPPPPVRPLVANHVPPVLPYQDNFRSPSRKARSTKSNHETLSSTSEHFVMDPVTGYEGSISDEMDQFERERNRNTIRPSPQQVHSQQFGSSNPASPLDQRRAVSISTREFSPPSSRRPLSPAKALLLDINASTLSSSGITKAMDRGRGGSMTPTAQQMFSPNGVFFDDNTINSSPIRRVHAHSASDAAAERERILELNERQQHSEREVRPNRREDRKQEIPKRRLKASDYADSSTRRTQDAWVVVPSPSTKNDRPSTSDAVRSASSIPRATQHTASASHSGPYATEPPGRYPLQSQSQYSTSRGHLPQIPVPPRGPPPPVPSSDSSRRHPGQAVPLNWAIKYVGDNIDQRPLQAPKQSRLMGAKSMDNLRANSNSNLRKASQNSLARPSIVGLREANTSTGSFMNMDPSPFRRDPSSAGLQRSHDPRSVFSPTHLVPSRPSHLNASQSQGDVGQNSQSQFRPLPIQGQSSGSGSNYLNTPSGPGVWRQSPEEPYPRPRSALDDIGASPAPSRPFRPLPPAGGSGSWVDVESAFDPEDSRSPRVSSPHHPYAAIPPMRPLPSASLSQASTKLSVASSATLAEPVPTDTQTAILESATAQHSRSLVGISSPDSPRRTPVDKRAGGTEENTETPKSFVSLTRDSPVYDGDNEFPGLTLKAEERAWLTKNIAILSSSDGTLKPSEKNTRMLDKPLPGSDTIAPYLLTKEASTSSSSTNNSATPTDEGDEYDSDDSLWKTPLKQQEPKRPTLIVDTESGKHPSVLVPSRTPYYPQNQQAVAPPLPPLPPPPPAQRRQKSKNSGKRSPADRSNRVSQFIKTSQSTWAYRPGPEEISEHLDSFFPDHDLDKPVIDSASGGSSPTAAEPAMPGFQNSSADKEKKSKHKKSIRIVATEHKKKNDRVSRSDSSTMSTIMRKRSTKLWGSKLEEVTTSQIPSVPVVPESPTAQNPKRELMVSIIKSVTVIDVLPSILAIFKWVRGELIGKGTYGRVYLALNATTGEMIAVKQVELPQTDADRDDKRQVGVVEALKLESDTLKDLDHPNIVQYLGFEQTPDFLSIFLEYVPGGSVAGCLRKYGKFDDQVSRSFTGQIIAGLEYLHSNGIIHRDLKADNVLVELSGVCKISDFGISKRTDDINENGIHTSMQGSVFWMAPEVVQAARKIEQHGYNGKVDIWSLGCVVLEMWAGRRPWQDVDAIAVIYELITKQGAPPVPPDVTLGPEADDFRRKCFAIKPDERPSATELRQHPYLILQPGWSFSGFK
ncbi:hypothetical protein EW145_g1989 [Phellinidium pouzarii]|uniref:Protein kinase domain-containing protein n=1 Tax=Phellinidium pouzarii TaxID=167371 RepID=A0A4S4LE71_9AGAM|nr:hypothetical protein EW145_g1989 [Phellinidium pouzarii]